MKEVILFDTTLRDGSYPIDYQFNTNDTALVAYALEECGFQYIEIGHGLGLNASDQFGKAAVSDEDYMRVTSETLTNSRWGFFFIPGIGDSKDIELAHRYGVNFIRIGTNITEVEKAKPFIELARSLGIQVFSNLMKSYVLDPKAAAEKAALCEKMGAEVVCLVDSAGGMLPHEITEYVERFQEKLSVPVGFHGHNNLHLAVANSLAAMNAGAKFIDCTIQGMGRSAGNTQSEVMVALCEKLGFHTGIDFFKTLNVGKNIVEPLMNRVQGVDDMAITTGIAQFHSSYMKNVQTAAAEYGVDPREVILKASAIDRSEVSLELAREVASKITKTLSSEKALPTELLRSQVGQPEGLAKELFGLSRKAGKKAVFCLSLSKGQNQGKSRLQFTKESSYALIGSSEIGRPEEALDLIQQVVPWVDVLLLDAEIQKTLPDLMDQITEGASKIIPFSDWEVWVRSIERLLTGIAKNPRGKRVRIVGDNDLATSVVRLLLQMQFEMVSEGAADFVLGLNFGERRMTETEISQWDSAQTIYIDGTRESFDHSAVQFLSRRGRDLIQVDMRSGMAAEAALALEVQKLIGEVMGRTEMAGLPVVAGGMLGHRGDIVVDSIKNPLRVLGVADGAGGLLPDQEGKAQKVTQSIVRDQIR